MIIKKIIYNKNIKSILKSLGLIFVKKKDNKLITEIKENFEHNERSFYYKKMRRIVDSIYCHAAPGTLESIILKLAKNNDEKNILNLGGGTGQVSSIFEFLGFKTTNVDLDLKKEDNTNIKFDLNSDKELTLAQNSFDYVMCQEIIEHVENPWKLLRMAKEHLKKDGTIFLTTPNIQSTRSKKLFSRTGYFEWFTPDTWSYHINAVPFWEIKLICDKLDLEITDLSGNGEYYFQKKRTEKEILNNNETLIFVIKNK